MLQQWMQHRIHNYGVSVHVNIHRAMYMTPRPDKIDATRPHETAALSVLTKAMPPPKVMSLCVTPIWAPTGWPELAWLAICQKNRRRFWP